MVALNVRNRHGLFAGAVLHFFGQIFQTDYSALGKHGGMLDNVFQLADISRIRILGQRIQGSRLKVYNLLALGILVFQNEILDQVRERRFAFTERRQKQVERIQAVV